MEIRIVRKVYNFYFNFLLLIGIQRYDPCKNVPCQDSDRVDEMQDKVIEEKIAIRKQLSELQGDRSNDNY